VLQTAVASLQSPDCDTEWLIGINVATGGVLCRKGIIRIYGFFSVNIDWVHKNVNQYVSLYLKLAIRQNYEYIKRFLWNHTTLRGHHCTSVQVSIPALLRCAGNIT